MGCAKLGYSAKPCKTVQMQGPLRHSWITTAPDSFWTPTPTSPPPRRDRRQIPWLISSPVLSGNFRSKLSYPKDTSRQLPASMGHVLSQPPAAKSSCPAKGGCGGTTVPLWDFNRPAAGDRSCQRQRVPVQTKALLIIIIPRNR